MHIWCKNDGVIRTAVIAASLQIASFGAFIAVGSRTGCGFIGAAIAKRYRGMGISDAEVRRREGLLAFSGLLLFAGSSMILVSALIA